MHLRPRAVVALSIVCCIVAVSACGNSSTPTRPWATAASNTNRVGLATRTPGNNPATQTTGNTPTPASGGSHEFVAKLSVTGAFTQSLDFTEPLTDLPPCSTLAKTGFTGATWSVPQPNSEDFYLQWNVTPYTGPGTYTDVSTFQDSVEIIGNQGVEYDPVDSSVLSLTIKADGSGSATFKTLTDAYSGDTVNGTETWTCK